MCVCVCVQVLCASSADKSNTELIRPPPEAKVTVREGGRHTHPPSLCVCVCGLFDQIGDRIAWEGLEGEPDEVGHVHGWADTLTLTSTRTSQGTDCMDALSVCLSVVTTQQTNRC